MRRRSYATASRPVNRWPVGSHEFAACEAQASAALCFDMAADAYDKGDWLEARYWKGVSWARSHRARVLAGVEEPSDFVLGSEDAAGMREALRRRRL